MELTKEHFEKEIKNLATQESVDDLAETVAKIAMTVNNHSASKI